MADRHMTPEQFRKRGYDVIDWIADYMENVETYRITPTVQPGAIRAMLPDHAPEEPEPFEAILRDLDAIVMPGVTHWQSPNWFAYFPANTSGPAILADLISSGLGQQGMLWATSPACTEVEMVVVDWLVDLLGLPQQWKTTQRGGGVIQMSASDSTHAALVTARHRAAARHPVRSLVVYASSQAHFSTRKGANVAGFEHVRLIEVDERYAMRVDALEDAVAADLAAGLVPAFVTSAVGTTGTTAVDPVRQVGEVAGKYGMWHHVDAAYAGTAMTCPEFRHHQEGLDLADSYVFNPHKWMFTNFDCSVFYVADRTPLIDAMTMRAPYMSNAASDAGVVIDYRDWHVPLGRRFRALKLWWVLRSYGAEGIRAVVREHVRLARELAERIDADPRLELVAPTPFALVSFRHLGGPAPTQHLAEALNATGRVHLTASRIDGAPFIRVSVGQTYTEQRHVDALWELIDELATTD